MPRQQFVPLGHEELITRVPTAELAVREPRASERPLVVGHAEDRTEHDADRVADAVLARLNHELPERHQHGAGCGHGASLQRIPASSAAPVVGYEGGALDADVSGQIDGARTGGRSLDATVRQRMEAGFGSSLGGVRIHDDAESARLSRSISARAFTTGKDIFFGAGEYRPDTPEGERVLAHELAHTQQQAGVSRTLISRLWDVKAKKIPWGQATHIRSLETRPIWFLADDGGNEIVVKPENQPVGLGSLVASMQKKVAKIKSVDQRKLDKMDRLGVDNQIEISGMLGDDAGWTKRGDFLKASDPTIPAAENSAEVARKDALEQLNNKKTNIIAMSVAEGEDALKAAAPTAPGQSRLRGLLEDKEHMKAIGRMTMVDLFLGNKDRTTSGNLGNWFYSPGNAITLIDHVDPGENASAEMTRGMVDNQVWIDTIGLEQLNSSKRKSASSAAVGKIIQTAGRDVDDSGGGDNTLRAWTEQVISGAKRREAMNAAVLAGMDEARAQIIKIFSTSKWNLTKRAAHGLKKKIRSAAKSGAAEDDGDAVYADGQKLDYYATLKARVQWLKAN